MDACQHHIPYTDDTKTTYIFICKAIQTSSPTLFTYTVIRTWIHAYCDLHTFYTYYWSTISTITSYRKGPERGRPQPDNFTGKETVPCLKERPTLTFKKEVAAVLLLWLLWVKPSRQVAVANIKPFSRYRRQPFGRTGAPPRLDRSSIWSYTLCQFLHCWWLLGRVTAAARVMESNTTASSNTQMGSGDMYDPFPMTRQ